MTIRQAGRYAIVGIGCRFPGGANSPQAFWQLLSEGRDAIRPVPEDRPDWATLYDPDPTAVGHIYTRLGGFIDDIDKFDARFFGISPREALHIDPQHRFLMEAVWHAFEDARIPLDRAAGSNTGVFVGISTHDYGDVQMDPRNHERIAFHTNTGCATAIAANRISYTYDLRGPSMSIDTACSSALTAAHIACNALDAGDCSLAVVAAVQLLLRPELTMGFCRATMLSVDGHCKAFDAGANGYVRAEGAGAVLLKPLKAALADRDPIYAVLIGTAANQDGRTSSITIPNEGSQREMLRTALARAGVAPSTVQYIEAHGPGTAVGDPIEARAIGSVFGEGRPAEQPLVVGSVKTNIGHLEAAAGIAGLIKAALALSKRQIPPSLHFHQWNPAIDPNTLQLRIATELQPWPDNGAAPVAAINSFGFGGANASAILAVAPEQPLHTGRETMPSRAEILPISAQTPDALRKLANCYSEAALTGEVALSSLCGALALGRSHLDERIAIVASNPNGLADALDAAIAGDNAANVARGRASSGAGRKTAFIFSGMGPQWWAMGRQLLDAEPVFAAMMQRCDQALERHSGWSLIGEFRASETDSRIAHPLLAQVSNFALQVALAELWRHWGIAPDAVLGHSGGAMAAAYLAGVHTLDDAIWLAFHRSQMQGRDSNAGEMLALGMSAEEAETLIRGHEDRISIAAINGPRNVTLSGDGRVLRSLAASLTEKQIFARMLAVTIAYHSPRMDPIRLEFLETVRDLKASKATLPLVSDTTGTWDDGAGYNADYWWRAIRSPVRFADSIRTLVQDGYGTFVEISPHPVLATSINECLREAGANGIVVPSLRRNEDERASMLRSLGALYVNGASPAWNALYARDVTVPLSLYPFERERHWFDPDAGAASQRIGEADVSALLGRRLPGAQPLWEARLDVPALGWIKEHVVHEQVILPGAAYVVMALAAARRIRPNETLILRDLTFQRPLIVRADKPRAQVSLDRDAKSFSVSSLAEGKSDWTRHAAGRIGSGAISNPPPIDLANLADRLGPPRDIDDFYTAVSSRGLAYGPTFRGIKRLRATAGEALVTVGPIDGLAADPDSIHPALLDAAFQALVAVANVALPDDTRTFLPVSIDEVRLYRPAGDRSHVHCRLDTLLSLSAKASFDIVDDAGEMLISIIGLEARKLNPGAANYDLAGQCFYEYRWEPKTLTSSEAPPRRASLIRLDPSFSETMNVVCRSTEAEAHWARYYNEAEPLLSAAAASHVLSAFATLGLEVSAGAVLDPDWLKRMRESEPSGGRWTDRLLGLLKDAGCIAADGANWRVLRVPDPTLAAARLPEHSIDFALLDQAGRTLSGALSGVASGRDAVFTSDSLPLIASFYREAPASAYYNKIFARALKVLVDKASSGGVFRVLEIGGGTGGATSAALSVLPPNRTRYVFTDNAAMLLGGAETAFGHIECVEIRSLDINGDSREQGFQPGAFDLIIAANVVHATPDVKATLKQLRTLLVPDGTLAMIEITRHPRWLDVIFGQTRGWWASSDRELRPEHPLLESAQWRTQLEEVGFSDVTMSSEREAIGEAAQTVIFARRPAEEEAAAPWLLLGADIDNAARLAGAIMEVGGRAIIEGEESAVDRYLDEGPSLSGIIDLRPATPCAGMTAVYGTLSLVRRLLARAEPIAIPLWVVTSGASELAGEKTDAAQAALIGLVRTVIREHPELWLRTADLCPPANGTAIAAFVREITEHDREEEVAFKGASRHVRRLRRETSEPDIRKLADHPLEWNAEIGVPGSLSSLRLRVFRPEPLSAHEVRIKVEAASLNFRDIVLAMGTIQGLEETDTSSGQGRLGSDCAGTVIEIGAAVTRCKRGDLVMAMAPCSLGSTAVTHESRVFGKPERLSFAEAAALPTVTVSAWYALKNLGHIGKGDRVLIHSAAGGVGLAAVQIAREAGAEIFATAGSTEKREYLRSLGLTHVMDSRALDFADQIKKATNGVGVDIVLNSLVGDAVERGMASLAPYGRFIEIGKADIYANSALPLGNFRRGLTYASFDLDRMMKDRPDTVSEVLAEIVEAVDAGGFEPLPVEIVPMAQIEDAFRKMALGRHIGKIVLVNDGERPALPTRHEIDCLLRSDSSYLITGGLGGFGLTVAEHLAEGRPGAIVLMGRNPPNAKAAARIDAIRRKSITIEVIPGDVSDPDDVAHVIRRIANELPPLKGILHGAMVLDDQRVATMDDAAMARVMAPKATGALNLHLATIDLPLDYFVLFSSITSLLGNPLQANYSAANAYLDALSHQRQAMGLPSLTINWGVLAGSGYVADRPELRRFLDQQGYLSFTRQEALEALDLALTRNTPQVMAARIDWGRMAGFSARSASSPRLTHLMPATGSELSAGAIGSEIMTALAAAPVEEKGPVIERYLMRNLARILGTSADTMNVEGSLDSFGLDSLLSVEFMVVLSRDLGFEMPVIALLDDMNIRRLGRLILASLATQGVKLVPAAVEPSAAKTRVPAPRPIAKLQPIAANPSRIVEDTTEIASPAKRQEAPSVTKDWTLVQKVARAVSRAGLAALGRADVKGLEVLPSGPFILAVNHLSMADVPLALSVIPRRTVMLANAKLQRNLVLDLLVGHLGEAIYLPKTSDVTPALEQALGLLRDGLVIALAPEGTRNRNGLGRAETGVAWLASRSGVPVVPYAAWGHEQWRDRFTRMKRLPMSVRIGTPIPPPSSHIGARDYSDLVMYRIAELLPKQYRGVYAQEAAAE